MDDLVEITDIESMGALVMQWHQNMLDRLMHYQQVPTGAQLTIENVTHSLEGDFLNGFIAAMQIFHSEMINNPPLIQTDDEPTH